MELQARDNLFDLLQKYFCPPLDSSLIAALLVELESDAEGNAVLPSQDEIDNLYATCNALALQADESQQSEFSESDILQTSQIDETISSWTTPDYDYEQSSGRHSGSSGSSDSSQHSFGSPLGFLQAALPDVPTTRLRRALLHAQKEDIDMWDIVAGILTEESILEMEERGLDGLEEGDLFFGGIDLEWQTVESKKKPSTKAGKKKVQPRSNKITLSDIRQQHHTRPPPYSSKATNELSIKRPTVGVTPDPWTQISSLSTHIASLLPPHPPSFFQSFFHSPNNATSYDALRAALTSLCKNRQYADNYTTIVSNLVDIFLPHDRDAGRELGARITADIRLSVTVADGRATDALDLVHVLRDLDTRPGMGLSHLLPTRASDSNGDVEGSTSRSVPPSPPTIPPPSQFKVKPKIKPPSATPSRTKPSPYQWQMVPQRKVVTYIPNPHTHHIPAYTRDVNGIKTQRDSRKSNSEEEDCKRRMTQATLKQRELLQQAVKMWKQGNSKTHGGEIAQHYAERSNQYLALARKEVLNLARIKVWASRKQDSVDLHGVNVANATIIIQEILEKEKLTISQGKPLKIITGRGTHSVNHKSVLKPALRQVLHGDGWIVSEWSAGLIVHGRQAKT